MPNSLTITVEEPDAILNAGLYGAGAVIRLETSLTETGIYADVTGTGSTPTLAVVTGTRSYTGYDPVGTVASWYRTRYENVGATRTSDYSAPFQSGSSGGYASLDDLLERLNLPDDTRYDLLEGLLVTMSSQFDAEAERQFYRVSGTRTYDGHGSTTLLLPDGCVSLTTVEISTGTGGAYTTLGVNEWRLRPSQPLAGWPYTRLELTDLATTWFTQGYDTVRLTGVFGWAAVPPLVNEAVIQLAQLTYNRSQTADSGGIGLADMGTMTLPSQRPDAWYRALRRYGRRAAAAI